MEYFKNIFHALYTIFVGMKITGMHLFEKKVTMQYPDLVHPIRDGLLPPTERNRIYVDMDRCNGCGSCVRACPVDAIEVGMVRVVPGDEVPLFYDGTPIKTWVTKYTLDFAKCCFCGLCIEACPTQANRMTPEFEYSEFERDKLIYHFERLTPEQAEEKKRKWEAYQAEKKKADAAAKSQKNETGN